MVSHFKYSYWMNESEIMIWISNHEEIVFWIIYSPFLNCRSASKSVLFVQGPTVSPVFCKRDGKVTSDYYAIVICVPKKALYKSVQQLRAVSHSICNISYL